LAVMAMGVALGAARRSSRVMMTEIVEDAA
jgi:hypothetical protein